MPDIFILVLQIIVVISAARLMGAFFKRMHQPQVVGEMFAGILLGPSLLGWVAPGISAYLFPSASLGHLNALSEIGLVVFMFLVGVGINPKELQGHGRSAILISHASITAPFVLASLLALYLYPRLSDDSVSFKWLARSDDGSRAPVLGSLSPRWLLHSLSKSVILSGAGPA